MTTALALETGVAQLRVGTSRQLSPEGDMMTVDSEQHRISLVSHWRDSLFSLLLEGVHNWEQRLCGYAGLATCPQHGMQSFA